MCVKFIPHWMVLLAMFFSISKYYGSVPRAGALSVGTDFSDRNRFPNYLLSHLPEFSCTVCSPSLSPVALLPAGRALGPVVLVPPGVLSVVWEAKTPSAVLVLRELTAGLFWHPCHVLRASHSLSSFSSSMWAISLAFDLAFFFFCIIILFYYF